MNVLVIGSGGREHALCWKLAQSSRVGKIYAAPGNPGIGAVAECLNPPNLSPRCLLAAATEINADLTVVGSEGPLVAGVVDCFREAGRTIVGPTAEAAQLEGSKIYAKHFFHEHGIPSARFVTVSNREDARRALKRFGFPVVLKADGLAAGKGVVIAHDNAEAQRALETLGRKLVIEEFISGEEVSFIALCDGKNVVPLEPAQDHKTIFDGDAGPNTGGMGAYCDSGILDASMSAQVLESIIHPAVRATGFTGFLYAGLMLTSDGPKALEFNVRLGDPETQPLMHRLSSDWAEILNAAARGALAGTRLAWKSQPSVCVVLASNGYPGTSRLGLPIRGIEAAETLGATVFHAGTRLGWAGLETAGGRVLGVTASGEDLAAAIENTYAAVNKIEFEGMQFRTDIGRKGLQRYNKTGSGT